MTLQLLRPDQPKGSLDLELDPDGNLWVGMSYQGGASKIDRKTKQVTAYPLNKEWQDLTTQTNMVTPTHMNVDGKVWMTDTATRNLYRLDIKTGKWENIGVANRRRAASRSAATASRPTRTTTSTCWSSATPRIGRLDAKTNVAKIWPRRSCARGRAAAASTTRTGCGSPNMAATRIGMFDPDDRAHQGVEAADAVEHALRRRAEQGRRPKSGPARC